MDGFKPVANNELPPDLRDLLRVLDQSQRFVMPRLVAVDPKLKGDAEVGEYLDTVSEIVAHSMFCKIKR